ncbi:unnamed protein product [Sphagnum jensenii]|uniref:Uncharacterized protein n=1 Tax=Sphagnum jensenii TaxID=128206 RepID=A0ABP1A702_9BRYO
MRFSPSEHLVAVAYGTNIDVFSSHTWTLLATLKGHKGVISAIAWSFDSIYLASTDKDGVMISWFMDEYAGYSKHVNNQGSIYTSILYEPSRQFIYACGPNVPLRIFDTDKISTSRQVLPELFSNPDYQLDPSKMYTRLDNQERVGTSLAHLIFRPAVKCETRSKGATRIVGMFDKGLLVATTGTGDMLLYGLPPSKDKTTLIWEEHINAGKFIISLRVSYAIFILQA